MTKPFDILSNVDKNEIINLFSDHEANRPEGIDKYAYGRIEELKRTDKIVFHKIKFNDTITDFLMHPHHGHNINLIPPNGKSVADALDLFFEKENQTPNSDCISKIRAVKKIFFDDNPNDWHAGFILIGDNKDLAHPGDDHYAKSDKEQYYIFNGFHRIMAYFLKMKESGQFRPLFLYYTRTKEKPNA